MQVQTEEDAGPAFPEVLSTAQLLWRCAIVGALVAIAVSWAAASIGAD